MLTGTMLEGTKRDLRRLERLGKPVVDMSVTTLAVSERRGGLGYGMVEDHE